MDKDNVVYTHTVEYNSAFKKEEIRTPATTGMNLGDIRLSEINQSQKTNAIQFY